VRTVPPAVFIVFSRRPRAAASEQYERYLLQVLGVPGFLTAARYDLVPALDEPAEPDRFTSAAVYEIEGSTPEAMAALAASGVPEGFGEAGLSSWFAEPLGERIGHGVNTGRQSLQVVFSDAGDHGRPVSDESLDGWYDQHLGEILSIPGFTSAQRYRLTTVARPEGGTIPGRRLAVYTTTKPPAELRAEMERMNLLSADSYSRLKDTDPTGPALPEWWDTVRFASWNLIPAGAP
jgi:hypothetical protein